MSQTPIPKTYTRDFLLSFQPSFEAPPLSLPDVIEPLFLSKGSQFPPVPRPPKTTPTKAATPFKATTPSKAARPAEKTPHTIPKRKPLAAIAKSTPAKTPLPPPSSAINKSSLDGLKNQTVAVNKENLVNARPPVAPPTPKLGLIAQPAKPAQPVELVEPSSPTETSKQKTPAVVIPPLAIKKNLAEVDDHRLDQRQKQIDYGYRTVGYQKYIATVPKNKREPGNPLHPNTPRKGQKCSKRSWDGQVRKWRRQLHSYDCVDEHEIAHWSAIIKEKFGDLEPQTDNQDMFDEYLSEFSHERLDALKPKTLVF